jgi:hypothetical protein
MELDSAILAFIGAYIIVVLVIMLAYYVIASLAYMKALKAVGYKRPWMAWIPCADYYALADAAANGQENVTLFSTLSVPAVLYKFWWAVMIVANFIPVVGTVLAWVIRVVFFGNCFVRLYAMTEHTSEQQQLVIGYVSGLLPIIAVIKFLVLKNNSTKQQYTTV